MKRVPLVDVNRLSEAIKLLEGLSAPQLEFMRGRWLHQIAHWDQWARDARWKYFALRAIVVLGGVGIPVLVTWQIQAPSLFLAVTASTLSAAVAAAAAWEGVANYGQTWLVKCRWTELLRTEGWLFIERAEKYAALDQETAFTLFAAQVEELVRKELGEYVASFDIEKVSQRLQALIEKHAQSVPKPNSTAGAT
jgi:hypothetical protein